MLERSVADAESARTGAADAIVHDPAPKEVTSRKVAAKRSSAAPAKKAAKRKPPRGV
ncbi:hypothetical protein [Streptomyces sp. NPDC058701]|uniref:hypothetical protein n=1 Tax=Streptomyces sp. NPDC058701 TaxID=3346608 RepID=UPI0036620875